MPVRARLPLRGILGWIVLERPIGRAFEILELAGAQRPEKGEQPKRAEQKRAGMSQASAVMISVRRQAAPRSA